MGTKNDTGAFDCYSQAAPDEPMFVLLGRDPTASVVVTFWRALKMKMVERGTSKSSKAKLDEARDCSFALARWAEKLGKDPKDALVALDEVLASGKGVITGDAGDAVLHHLRQAAALLSMKPELIEDLVKKQNEATARPASESNFVCSMLYAAAEVIRG